jgi:hypothetical protein
MARDSVHRVTHARVDGHEACGGTPGIADVRALRRLVTGVCAMTFAVVARLVYDTPLARMPLDKEGMPYGDHQSG